MKTTGPRPDIDPAAQRAKRVSMGAGVAALGTCCAVKLFIVTSLAFSGAATASRAWARLALVALALLAGAGAVVLARRRRRCGAPAVGEARSEETRSEVGAVVNGTSGRVEVPPVREAEDVTIGSGTTKG